MLQPRDANRCQCPLPSRLPAAQHLPGVTADMPLKVVFYKPGHVAKARGKA